MEDSSGEEIWSEDSLSVESSPDTWQRPEASPQGDNSSYRYGGNDYERDGYESDGYEGDGYESDGYEGDRTASDAYSDSAHDSESSYYERAYDEPQDEEYGAPYDYESEADDNYFYDDAGSGTDIYPSEEGY